ncbi:hypothetical protein L2E82_34060 [Cichorium intybus]|uniref:Uncharacterized protein n=1 Tax=Cichorium intybus TaxID=13427 RepID=A0ACB9BLJ3_CICIN|nr:hypothetical protein L2E82_34060 [Cichorium intybus]
MEDVDFNQLCVRRSTEKKTQKRKSSSRFPEEMQFRRSDDRNKETGGWRRCCSTVGQQLFRGEPDKYHSGMQSKTIERQGKRAMKEGSIPIWGNPKPGFSKEKGV